MPTRRHLIAAAALAALPPLRATAAPATPSPQATFDPIVDAGWARDRLTRPGALAVALQDPGEFAQAHLPGAVQVTYQELDLATTTVRAVEEWRTTMAAKFAAFGVAADTEAIAYDPGTFYAARIWWVLDQIGVPAKRVLSGGLPAWQAAGNATAIGPAEPNPAPSLGVTPNEDGIATIDEVAAAVGAKSATFIDARSREEYAAGHIPGAINVPFLANGRDEPGHPWKSAAELAGMYAAAGLRPDAWAIPYCTTGVRSAATFLALRVAGHARVSLFTGSWREWSAYRNAPFEVGTPPA